MASLWKHPESRYWVACFSDESGRQRKRSTKTTKRADAQKIADAWEGVAKRKLSRGQALKVLSELFEGETVAEVTVRAFAEGWLRDLKAAVAAATYSAYSNGVAHFLESLGSRDKLPLLHLARSDIARYRKLLEAGHPNTGNQRLKLVKMMLKAGREQGLLFDDPFTGVRMFREEKEVEGARRVFTAEELRRVLGVADPEWRSMILLGFYTGLRLGDIAALRWNQLNRERGEIELIVKKTSKRLLIPIGGGLAGFLGGVEVPADGKALLHPRAAKLVAGAKGKVSTVSRQFGELLESVGLREGRGPAGHEGEGKGRAAPRRREELSFHSLRHSARSAMEAAGVPLKTAMDLLGHSDAGMSLKYAHVDGEALRRAADSVRLEGF